VLPPTAIESLKPESQGVTGFTMGTPYISIEEKYYTQFKETYDRVVFSFPFERNSVHYLGRHVLGIILLVGMAALTLCMPAEDENRLGFCQASFFGIVAWQMILTVTSPPTGYDTRLDVAINTALAIVFCLFAYNAVRLGSPRAVAPLIVPICVLPALTDPSARRCRCVWATMTGLMGNRPWCAWSVALSPLFSLRLTRVLPTRPQKRKRWRIVLLLMAPAISPITFKFIMITFIMLIGTSTLIVSTKNG
jgi:hypothetical protein